MPGCWLPSASSTQTLSPSWNSCGASPLIGPPYSRPAGLARQFGIDLARALGHVGPVEAQHVLGALGDQAVAQRAIREHALDHLAERLRVAGAETQPGLVVGDDLAQASRVGD